MLDLDCDFAFGPKLGFVAQGDDPTTIENIRGKTYEAHPEAAINPNSPHNFDIGICTLIIFHDQLKAVSWHRGWKDGDVITDLLLVSSRPVWQLK